MTRGQGGSLLLSCIELSSTILRQFHWRTNPPGRAAVRLDRSRPGIRLLNELKSTPWYGVGSIMRNSVSRNFRIELGKFRERVPVAWRNVPITKGDGRPADDVRDIPAPVRL